MILIKHDVSNGNGQCDYLSGDEIVARNYGPNAETDSEIEARLSATIINYEDSDEKKAYDDLQWMRDRQAEYAKKTPVEQIEMMADGTFNAWYAKIKSDNPKT